MSSQTMKKRARHQLNAADRARYEQGQTHDISNAILKELLLAADQEHTAEGDDVGLPPSAWSAIVAHASMMGSIAQELTSEHDLSLELGQTLQTLQGQDLASGYRARSNEAARVTRAAETATEVAHAGAMAALPIAVDTQKPDVARLYRVGEELRSDLGTFRAGFDGALSVPGAHQVTPGVALSDEIDRLRPGVATLVEMAEALQGFDPGSQDLQAVADRITTLCTSDGDAAYLLHALFTAELPFDLCEAFCVATGQAMADHPVQAAEALAREGRNTGGNDVLSTELAALGEAVKADQGHTFRVATTPDLATPELVAVWSAVVRAHNHMVDFEAAMGRMTSDDGVQAEAGDLQCLVDAPDAALAAWSEAVPWLSAGVRLEDAKLADWPERMETARGEGRLEARVRQGFLVGVDDNDAGLVLALDIAARAVALEERAAGAAMRAGLAGLSSGGHGGTALAGAIAGINSAMTVAEKVEVLRKHGLLSAEGGKAAGEAGLAIIGVVKASAKVAGAATSTLKALRELELGSVSDSLETGGLSLVDEFNAHKRITQLQGEVASLSKAMRLCEGAGAIGDVAGVVTGVMKIMDGDAIGGGLDIVSGGLGLAGFFAGSTALGSGAAIGAAGGTLSTIAGPLGLGLAYISLIHESLGRAYSGFRDVSVKGIATDFNTLMEATLHAQAQALAASHAVELNGSSQSGNEGAVYRKALDAAAAAALVVHDRCHDALSIDGFEWIAHQGAGWTSEVDTLRADFETASSGGPALLRQSRDVVSFTESATYFAAGSKPIFEAAGTLGDALRDRVETYIEAQDT